MMSPFHSVQMSRQHQFVFDGCVDSRQCPIDTLKSTLKLSTFKGKFPEENFSRFSHGFVLKVDLQSEATLPGSKIYLEVESSQLSCSKL